MTLHVVSVQLNVNNRKMIVGATLKTTMIVSCNAKIVWFFFLNFNIYIFFAVMSLVGWLSLMYCFISVLLFCSGNGLF